MPECGLCWVPPFSPRVLGGILYFLLLNGVADILCGPSVGRLDCAEGGLIRRGGTGEHWGLGSEVILGVHASILN